MMRLLGIFTILCALSTPLFSEIKPIDYNLTLKLLSPFEPGGKITDIPKTANSKVVFNEGGTKVTRFQINQIGYIIPIFVQEKEGVITDYFVRLPSHFLHDLFHKTLIDKFGKQDAYTLQKGNGLYLWLRKDEKKMVYSGSCTITCFPLFLTVIDEKKNPTVTPIYKRLNTIMVN